MSLDGWRGTEASGRHAKEETAKEKTGSDRIRDQTRPFFLLRIVLGKSAHDDASSAQDAGRISISFIL